MAGDKIRVGIIGVHPTNGWAAAAHIPALRSLDAFEITAVATRRQHSALAASLHFGIPASFGDPQQLIDHPEVDLVVVTVRVPFHFDLVKAAIKAGKHVFCEWPLTFTAEEAEQLLDLAHQKGVRHFVGLQARAAPVIAQVRELIAEGYVGRVLSTSVIASGMGWGAAMPAAMSILADRANGATMLSVPGGHFIDAVCWCLGEIRSLSATMAQLRNEVTIIETGEIIPLTVPDQFAVTGTFDSGAVASIHFRSGVSNGTNGLWEINGTDGDLVITSDGGLIQLGEPALKGARSQDSGLSPIAINPHHTWVPPETPRGLPFNVAQHYALIARDLRTGTALAAGFDVAVTRHRLLDAIERAADAGRRQEL